MAKLIEERRKYFEAKLKVMEFERKHLSPKKLK